MNNTIDYLIREEREAWWQKKPEVKKGNFGEWLVDEWYIGNKGIPFSPPIGMSHLCDRFVVYPSKGELIMSETKTKPKRRSYPDTGIDISQYQIYKEFSEAFDLKFELVFVDRIEKRAYGNYLSELEKFKHEYKGIVYFPLEKMKTFFTLSEQQVEELGRLEELDRWRDN